MKVILDEDHLIRLIKADLAKKNLGHISAIKFSNTKAGIEAELVVIDSEDKLSEPQVDVEIKRPTITVEDEAIISGLK
jgi:hypothetical protein